MYTFKWFWYFFVIPHYGLNNGDKIYSLTDVKLTYAIISCKTFLFTKPYLSWSTVLFGFKHFE